jgi:type III pantothenate kinase
VPDVVHSLKNCCRKYFNVSSFILQPGVKTGLQIKYRNPLEVGSDRIANIIAASHLYPGRNLIVIDYGTATTFDVATAKKEYLGGAIMPGLRISMEALESKTARLPSVEILAADTAVGKSTVESIQTGLYYGNIGATRELVARITEEAFDEPPIVLGTGGFASLFEKARIFDAEIPDLVLRGMFLALKMNV